MRYIKKLIPQKIKNIYHLGQAVLANFWYGFPARKGYAHSVAGGPAKKLKVIGVTGTNGKTTTCQMIAKVLEEAGFKTAMISTINFKLGEKEWINKTKFTTLSSFFIQKFAWEAAVSGCEYLILEVSSHALDQNRVWGINFDTAVITNVTREHLDYHKIIKEYREAKLRLFEKARMAVVNLDIEKPETFLHFNNEEKFVYSIKYNVSSIEFKKLLNIFKNLKLISADKINTENNQTLYFIHDTLYTLNLLGKFNVENALAAACVGLAYGIDLKTMAKALEKIKGIPGRLEFVPNNKGFNIIIDYAVTPDSLNKLYNLVKDIRSNSLSLAPYSRVISVFGACGERDRGKRPIMGEIVAKYADYVILTNEDPYGENPQKIIEEISKGIKSKKLNESYWKILDRREAIKKALQIAKPGDYVIITGKGAEETMAIGDKRIPWNDKKVTLELLQELE